jgi:hypothetical protein
VKKGQAFPAAAWWLVEQQSAELSFGLSQQQYSGQPQQQYRLSGCLFGCEHSPGLELVNGILIGHTGGVQTCSSEVGDGFRKSNWAGWFGRFAEKPVRLAQ